MGSTDKFEQTVVIVTGGASGIGEATAERFAQEGASVVVADVDTDAGPAVAETLCEETAGEATFVETDVTETEDVESMVSTAREEYGGLDVGVNNAGVGSQGKPVADIGPSEWQSVIDVNLTGVWRCMAHELDAMVADGGGVIVNTASILGQVGSENAGAYSATKHGVIGLTRTAAIEYASEGIRVNAVCPGYTDTQLLNAADRLTEEKRKALQELNPMNRFGEPEEIADGIVWLASDDASFTNGETLAIDGGYLSK